MNDIGFSIRADAGKEPPYIQRLLTAIILFAGFFGCLWTIMGLGDLGVSPAPLLLTGAAYCAAFCGLKGRWRILSIIALAALFVYFYAAWCFMSDGWNAALNQTFETFEGYLGRILPRYAVVNGEQAALSAGMFLIVVFAVLAILCGRTAMTSGVFSRRLSALLAIALGVVAILFCAGYPLLCVLALIAAAAVLSGTRLTVRELFNGRASGGAYKRLPAIVGVLLCLSVVISIPLSGLNKNAEQARLQTERSINAFRYDAETDTAPEGDFSRISEYASMGDSAFFSARAAGEIYYFKGYTGETYTGGGWVSMESERKAEYAELFSWLHDRGFFAQSQLAALREALGLDTDAPAEVSVMNPDGYSKYLYAPYEVIQNKPDIYRIGDENLLAGGFKGEREYTIALSSGNISDYEALYSELNGAFGRGDTAAVEYLKSENGFRDFVYENYLEAPEESLAAIQDFLGGFVPPEDGLPFDDAKTIVDSYINSLPYADAPEDFLYRGDFAANFLSGGNAGNSLHFSTIETLLFRYLGVPARYAEGYILTESELEAAQDGGFVTINPQNLRAWTEIYRDGVGFVPFELNPPDLSRYDQSMADQPMEPQQLDETQQSPHILLLRILLFALLAIAILLAAGFAVLAIRRLYIRKRHMRFLAAADNGEAVCNAASYLIWLVSHAGISYKNGSLYALCPDFEKMFGSDISGKYSKVVGIQQQAIFSGLAIYDEERVMVTGFLTEITNMIEKQAGMPRRLRLKWVDCVI